MGETTKQPNQTGKGDSTMKLSKGIVYKGKRYYWNKRNLEKLGFAVMVPAVFFGALALYVYLWASLG